LLRLRYLSCVTSLSKAWLAARQTIVLASAPLPVVILPYVCCIRFPAGQAREFVVTLDLAQAGVTALVSDVMRSFVS
jgi:hypothetical protein